MTSPTASPLDDETALDRPRRTPPARLLAPAPEPVVLHPALGLVVAGELDAEAAERLRAELDDAVAPGRQVVLDVSGVDHVSAAALAVLVAAHRRLRDGAGCLVLASPSPAVVRVLRVSGLHRVLTVEDAPAP